MWVNNHYTELTYIVFNDTNNNNLIPFLVLISSRVVNTSELHRGVDNWARDK